MTKSSALFDPMLKLTPVSVSMMAKPVSVGTAIYLGMKILSHPVIVRKPVPSVIDCSVLDADFVAEVTQELTTTLDVLAKSVDGRREFHMISRELLVYVHQFNKQELTANSSVSISAWDKLAEISDQMSRVSLTSRTSLPHQVECIDFRPVRMDNVALMNAGLASAQFLDVFNGKTPSLDCQEYTYECAQYGHNWKERVWTQRLFWILKKRERELRVQVHNVSQSGQHWEDTMADVLRTSKVALNSTPFKGVTDILLVGETNVMTVLVRNDATVESAWNYMEKVGCNIVVLELGLGAPVRIECPIRVRCPTSLANCCPPCTSLGLHYHSRNPKRL